LISELIPFLQQGGGDFVEVVNVATDVWKVYKIAGRTFNYLRGFIGPKQEENLHEIGEAARAKLAGLDPSRFSEPSPSILTPLLEAACQESREELQELWACLLANAVTKGNKVRIDFAEVLKQLDPQDALALSVVKDIENEKNPTAARQRLSESGLAADEWLFSREKLARLRLIDKGPANFRQTLTPFGRLLLAACSAPSGDTSGN